MSFEERIYAFRDIKDMEPIRGAKTPNKGLREERFELGVEIWLLCRRMIRISDADIIKARWSDADFNSLFLSFEDCYTYNMNGYMEQTLDVPLLLFDLNTENIFPVLVSEHFYYYVTAKDSIDKLSRTHGNKLAANNWKELGKIIYDFANIINREFDLSIYEYLRVKKERLLVRNHTCYSYLDMDILYKKKYGEVAKNKK